ncbi:DUF6415 family natural product biosynthesis protein [Streptomyces sp. UNOC14_S4]|uniref:DUF6415 family natural product biosynthesis protein n=1 Tax=Streptomyces sp. UNOC14_S4 TaxID=2872340 RepID=UPI001E3BA17D|nr:DUF6415 family natural product biosynthesis protein [Streptomyces sp. UNOC14_S4]MCC3767655.1 hypothetical protein [Streptomyces sp. UNOC14_S4]
MPSLPPLARRPTLNAVIRRTLDRTPSGDDLDRLVAALGWHLVRLMAEVAAKDWEEHGQDKIVGVILDGVRAKLDSPPGPGAEVAARAVYAQELARTCQALLGLALAEPGDGAGVIA